MSKIVAVEELFVSDGPQATGCLLGRELGDCPLKRAGCGNLYDALMFVMPPFKVREYLKATMGNDTDVQKWLAHLDAVTPQAQPAARTRGWWR